MYLFCVVLCKRTTFLNKVSLTLSTLAGIGGGEKYFSVTAYWSPHVIFWNLRMDLYFDLFTFGCWRKLSHTKNSQVQFFPPGGCPPPPPSLQMGHCLWTLLEPDWLLYPGRSPLCWLFCRCSQEGDVLTVPGDVWSLYRPASPPQEHPQCGCEPPAALSGLWAHPDIRGWPCASPDLRLQDGGASFHLWGKGTSPCGWYHLHLSLSFGGCLDTKMTSQPVSSIFLCSPLPSWTRQTPVLPISWCCLSSFFSVCLVFFPLPLCLARQVWPDLMNGRHVHTTPVCTSLWWSGCLCVVWLPAGSWHRFLRW